VASFACCFCDTCGGQSRSEREDPRQKSHLSQQFNRPRRILGISDGSGSAGVSPAVFKPSHKTQNRRRDAGATIRIDRSSDIDGNSDTSCVAQTRAPRFHIEMQSVRFCEASRPPNNIFPRSRDFAAGITAETSTTGTPMPGVQSSSRRWRAEFKTPAAELDGPKKPVRRIVAHCLQRVV